MKISNKPAVAKVISKTRRKKSVFVGFL